ncbi:hypothetical protein [Saccharopolyspora flava]|uniref:hypothetical protein n=1 Tax=Saccharopolyspora flava TaxID=95161 RepID=UPI001587B6D5|nr:hypothetical protein [Saccharopolyspora flava]
MIASVASATLLLTAAPAQAHHGWDDFDTDRLYYVAGTVSQVRRGEPHSFFTVTVDRDLPAGSPKRELPEELQAPEDSGPFNVAPSYSGSHNGLEVVIAPPSYTGRWGLDQPLRDGERVELVGYINTSHDNEFRPVAFWYEKSRPVNQALGSELPETPLPPRTPTPPKLRRCPHPIPAIPLHGVTRPPTARYTGLISGPTIDGLSSPGLPAHRVFQHGQIERTAPTKSNCIAAATGNQPCRSDAKTTSRPQTDRNRHQTVRTRNNRKQRKRCRWQHSATTGDR